MGVGALSPNFPRLLLLVGLSFSVLPSLTFSDGIPEVKEIKNPEISKAVEYPGCVPFKPLKPDEPSFLFSEASGRLGKNVFR